MYADDVQVGLIIPHGKHKGKALWQVMRDDPNYALYAAKSYAWFPKLTRAQKEDCQRRYVHLPPRDWSTYDMADYGDGWS